MRNPTETIGNLVDKQSVSLISSIDENQIGSIDYDFSW